MGEMKGGERHGIGRLQYDNGNLYVGGWEREVKSGFGMLAWTNKDGPTVTYRLRALGEFYERYELWAFPFDSQDLQLVLISSYAYVDNAVPLQLKSDPDRSNVNSKFFLLRDEYAMSAKLLAVSDKSDAARSATGSIYPRLSISAKITRRVGLYLWTIVRAGTPCICPGFQSIRFLHFLWVTARYKTAQLPAAVQYRRVAPPSTGVGITA